MGCVHILEFDLVISQLEGIIWIPMNNLLHHGPKIQRKDVENGTIVVQKNGLKLKMAFIFQKLWNYNWKRIQWKALQTCHIILMAESLNYWSKSQMLLIILTISGSF